MVADKLEHLFRMKISYDKDAIVQKKTKENLMKTSILRSAQLCVVGAALVASSSMASTADTNTDDSTNTQTLVDTLGQALDLSPSASHHEGSELGRIEADMKRLYKICSKIEATEEQKTVIRDDVFAFKEKTLPLETQLKLARLKYVHTALSANGLEADASARVTDAVTAVSAIAQAKGDLVTKMLFQTLKPEQRKPALVCLAAMKLVHGNSEESPHSLD
jgi:hypothetical protein